MIFFFLFSPALHRIFLGWRGPLEIIQSELSAKAGDTGMYPEGFGVSPEKDSPQPPRTAYSSNIKKFYLMLRWSLGCFSSCPLLLILSGSTESGLATTLLAPTFVTDIYALMGFLLSLLYSQLNFLKGISAQAGAVCSLDFVLSLAVTSWGAFSPSPCQAAPRRRRPAAERARHLVGSARLAGRPQPGPAGARRFRRGLPGQI